MSTHLDERTETRPATEVESPRRWWGFVFGIVVILVLAALAAVVINDDDETTTASTATTATTAPPASTSTTPSTTPTTQPGADLRAAVFPTDGSGYDAPTDAARAFAVELGFRAPIVGEFQQGDSRSGEVEIRPNATGPATTVFVRQLGADDAWFVLGSATASIQLADPGALDEIASPVRLQGTSTAFEARVNVEIWQDAAARVLGAGSVMGGANGEMGPFDGLVGFEDPTSELGAIVLRTFSMQDGSTWEASVVRVAFSSAGPDSMSVQVFFHNDPDGPPVPYTRTVPAAPAALHTALDQLLAGPTDTERQAGATSFFSSATADMLEEVTLHDGQAVVDFGDLRTVIPNASSSTGSQILLSELDATVFQFDTVDSVIYRIDGNADDFYEWLQLSAPAG